MRPAISGYGTPLCFLHFKNIEQKRVKIKQEIARMYESSAYLPRKDLCGPVRPQDSAGARVRSIRSAQPPSLPRTPSPTPHFSAIREKDKDKINRSYLQTNQFFKGEANEKKADGCGGGGEKRRRNGFA